MELKACYVRVTKNDVLRVIDATEVNVSYRAAETFAKLQSKEHGVYMQTSPNNVITLRLRELSQLFNSMDPSPFVKRDLDADARRIHYELGTRTAR